MTDTKVRILDAAEKLFARHGFAATSLRAITSEAKVNLAAVNYHFRSKNELIAAVFTRRLQPLNQRRLELLNAVETRAGQGILPLEEVLEAFIAPVFPPGGQGEFAALMGRMWADPAGLARRVVAEEMQPVMVRFLNAFRRAIPDVPEPELLWRAAFSVGAMLMTVLGRPLIEEITAGRCQFGDRQALIARLVNYTAAGFRAPVPNLEGQS